MNSKNLQAGAAQIDITPSKPSQLCGYPHVQRVHTGVHDPLFSSALFLDDGNTKIFFIANDLLYIPKEITAKARLRISKAHSTKTENIMITATHTHSGPSTVGPISKSKSAINTEPDPQYLKHLEDSLVAAADNAANSAKPAILKTAQASSAELGTNRHDPKGPSCTRLPVLAAYDKDDKELISIMVICNMHPTVLHEDSKLITGDFPGCARAQLQKDLLAPDKPFVYHMGVSGNQSPRHVVEQNTFEQADRLGGILKAEIEKALEKAKPIENPLLSATSKNINLPERNLPPVAEAQKRLEDAQNNFNTLKANSAPRAQTRTAECDVFGAEATLRLAKAKEDGSLNKAINNINPAEVQLIKVGEFNFIGWPGEVFVEFGLQIIEQFANTYITTLTNSPIYGYLVTKQAIENKAYEANNAIFQSPQSAEMLVETTKEMIN